MAQDNGSKKINWMTVLQSILTSVALAVLIFVAKEVYTSGVDRQLFAKDVEQIKIAMKTMSNDIDQIKSTRFTSIHAEVLRQQIVSLDKRMDRIESKLK